MTAAARTDLRRGACPGLSTPMQTGDGLLARLLPANAMTSEMLAGLCVAAHEHGNSIIEITSRGNIQVRGLTAKSARKFAAAARRLGLAHRDGIPVITDPLAGIATEMEVDAERFAGPLRRALAPQRFALPLAPKVSVLLDGNAGALHLDGLAADIRLRAAGTDDGLWWHVALGGDAGNATPIGAVRTEHVVEAATRLLSVIARHGAMARARDVIATAGLDTFRAVLEDLLVEAPLLPLRPRAEPIGIHEIWGNEVAIGIGFPFGHTDAARLRKLVDALSARDIGYRPAPGRALLLIGIPPKQVGSVKAKVARLGFIVEPDDPRRRVVACAGSPICASGEIAARTLAGSIAQTVAPMVDPDEVIHLSGCAKGCAHRGRAALTVIGRHGACDVLVDDTSAGSCAADLLPQYLAEVVPRRQPKVRHG
jgi:precorrin-3B synthase